jgi:hypothetical protein
MPQTNPTASAFLNLDLELEASTDLAPIAQCFDNKVLFWLSCNSRSFDYGFDGGLEEKPFNASIRTDFLTRMSNLGIDLRITVYPFRDGEPEGEVAQGQSGEMK